MLYKFKSKDTGDVIMLEPNGRHVLEIIGKEPGPKGIILPEQMAPAIAALHAAIAHEESSAQAVVDAGDTQPPSEEMRAAAIGLRQRAMPFIEMLERNLKDGNSVVWGV